MPSVVDTRAPASFVRKYDTGPDVTPNTQALFLKYGRSYRWLAVVTIMSGSIASLLTSTIINVAIPAVMGAFGMTLDQSQWLSSGFLAAATVTMLLSAWAVEAFGMKAIYITGMTMFMVGSVLGGLSMTADMLIFSRIVQGASTGLIGPIGMIITFQVFPPHRRGRAMGIFGVGMMLAPALGPTVGGVLIDQFSWHYVFFMAVPFGIFALPMAIFFVPDREAFGERPPFDWIGLLLMLIFIPSLMLGFSSGQHEGWHSTIILSYFTIAAVSGIVFVVWENHTVEPMLNLQVFLNKRFVAAAVVSTIMGAGLYGSTYLVPLFLQTIQELTPTASGLLMMPAGLFMAFVFLIGGELSDRFPSRVLIISGLALFALSSVLLSTVDLNTPYWSLVWWAIVGRVGLGLIFPSLNRTALSVLSFDLLAQGAGALNFLRQLGSAFGVNLIAIELERRTSFFRDVFFTTQGEVNSLAMEETIRQVQLLLTPAGLSYVEQIGVSMGYLSQAIATQAGIMGFRDSFLIVGVLFLACLIPAWFMPGDVPDVTPESARPPKPRSVSAEELRSELLDAD